MDVGILCGVINLMSEATLLTIEVTPRSRGAGACGAEARAGATNAAIHCGRGNPAV